MTDDRPVLGRTIANKYRIESVLGEGGMGVVYEGTHEGTGGKVAVKMLRKEAVGDQEHFDRFELEARVSSRIETGHVIRVYDCGKESGAPFLVMELLKGKSLAQLITERGPLPERLALRIIAQAALGLGRAHAAGVIHRDIKTDNLFLAEADDAVVVKVLDFGIAKLRRNVGDPGAATRLTETGRLLGTPLYMSPEQAQGLDSVDHRTDIWSLGVVLFEALTGRPPLHRVQNLGKLIVELCAAPPPLIRRLLPDASPEVEDLLSRALMLDPALRFESIDAFRAQILSVLGTGHQVSPSELAYERIETPSERGVLSTDRLILPTTVSKPAPAPHATKIQVNEPRHDPTPRSPQRAHDATMPSFGAADSERTQPDGTPVIEARNAPPLPPLVPHPAAVAAPPSSAIVLPERSRAPLILMALAAVAAIGLGAYFLTRPQAPTHADAGSTTPAQTADKGPQVPPPPPLEATHATAETTAVATPSTTASASAKKHADAGHKTPTAEPKTSAAPIAPPTAAPVATDPPHAGKFE